LPIYGLIEIQVLWFFHYIVILIEIYPWNIIILVHFLGWLLSFRMSTLKSPIIVATLTLGLQRCGPKRKPGSHILCSWEWRRVWRDEPSHSQMSSHFGSWSPNGLLNLQRAIARVKTHWIEEFLISLGISWNLDV
jgi:hypothetical protein